MKNVQLFIYNNNLWYENVCLVLLLLCNKKMCDVYLLNFLLFHRLMILWFFGTHSN